MKASSDKKSKPISRASAPKLRRRQGDSSGVPVRLEFDQDSTSVTSLKTPAPLPPTPMESDDGWFEQMPTNPSQIPEQIPDLGALAGRSETSVPSWARAQRKATAPGIREEARTSNRDLAHHVPAPHRRSMSYGVVALVAAVCLAVGMVLGALLEERLGASRGPCPEPAAHERAAQ